MQSKNVPQWIKDAEQAIWDCLTSDRARNDHLVQRNIMGQIMEDGDSYFIRRLIARHAPEGEADRAE